MKKLLYLTFALVAMCFAACGNSENSENSETPKSVELETYGELGELGDYISLEDDITLMRENSYIKGSIGLSVDKAVAHEYGSDFCLELSIQDASHIEIASLSSETIDHKYDMDSNLNFIGKGKTRTEFSYNVSDDTWQKIVEKGKYFVVKCEKTGFSAHR